jgi:hypothetical protein
MAILACIEADVPFHTHILREEPDHSLSMLYGRKAIRLPNLELWLYFYESLTL